MPILDSEKRKLFQEQGFILLENAIDSQLLKGLQRDFSLLRYLMSVRISTSSHKAFSSSSPVFVSFTIK